MTPETAADVIVFIILSVGVVTLICIIYSIIKDHRNPGSTQKFNQQSASPLFGSHERKKYSTVDGLFGDKIHFDENGNYAGSSVPTGSDGSMVHFDANGDYAGSSSPGLFKGDMIHTDAKGNYVGQSSPGLFGTTVHTGKNGEIGATDDGVFGSKVTDIDFFDN